MAHLMDPTAKQHLVALDTRDTSCCIYAHDQQNQTHTNTNTQKLAFSEKEIMTQEKSFIAIRESIVILLSYFGEGSQEP